jgi:hypothetical protein
MGGGGGKDGGDNSEELYRKQQADLAKMRADEENKERLAREAERAQQEDLRKQMLANRNVLSEDEDLSVARSTLG